MPFKGNFNRPGGPADRGGPGRRAQGGRPQPSDGGPKRPSAPRSNRPQPQPEDKTPGLVSSLDNDKARFLRNLLNKKDRYAARFFLAEGVRLVEEALRAKDPLLYTLYDPEALQKTEAGKRLLMRLIELAE